MIVQIIVAGSREIIGAFSVRSLGISAVEKNAKDTVIRVTIWAAM